MKNLLLMLAVVIGQSVKAATYYFSSLSGSDSYSNVQAQNPATPWRSLSKLNAFSNSLQPGDSILFHRGETFPGQLVITQSGNAFSKIVYGSYGTGANPVISGFFKASSWTNTGGGIWETGCSSCGNVLNLVTIDGINKAMGRHPNADAANKGYWKFESHAGNTQITDNELTGSPNWNGAEIVIRKNYWTLDRNIVTSHSNATVNFISPTGHPLLDNYGYFFQNHVQTLDQWGEWYYDRVQKKVKAFFGAAGPGALNINFSVVDTLVTIAARQHLLFFNLDFEGADTTAFAINNAVDIRIQNCRLRSSGTDAINARNSEQVVIESCSFDQTNNNAIRLTDCNRSEVRNTSIHNTGMLAGMGLSNNQMYEAIYTRGNSNTVEYNEVINTGYSAITFSGNNAIVRNNFIDHYTMVLDDGGGIYGWGDFDKTGRVITGNIILNGIGAPEGTDVTVAGNSSGIYLDDRSANVDINNNTVAAANRAGIYLHNSHEIVINNNTLFNNGAQMAMVHDDLEPADPIRNVSMQNNIFFSRTDLQSVMNSASRQDDIAQFGVYSSNYYARPIDQNGIIQTDYRNGSGQYVNQRHSLPAWKALYNNDIGSLPSPLPILPYIINNIIGGNRCTNGNFNANINGAFCMSSPSGCATSWNSGGRLDGGALEIRSTGGYTNISTHISAGAVQAGKNYRIRFSLLGSVANQTIGAYILKNGAPYNALSEKKYFALGTTRSENEFLFTAATSESDVYLVITANNTQQPFWVDNIDVREVNANVTNPDDYIRFEYNRTSAPRSVVLDGAYFDVRNNPYVNTITLAPFSSAVLIRTGIVLPIKFTDVIAVRRDKVNLVEWSVSDQKNLAGYSIERSVTGSTFSEVGFVAANNNAIARYEFNDSTNSASAVCYRIKSIGRDGQDVYSKQVCLKEERVATIRVFPNPVLNKLEVLSPSGVSEKFFLTVRDSRGIVMKQLSGETAGGRLSIDLSSFADGVYFLSLQSGKETFTKRIVKITP